jgi:O-Antigen ligase
MRVSQQARAPRAIDPIIIVASGAATALGAVTALAPVAGLASIVAGIGLVGLALWGLQFVTVVALGSLPWFVFFGSVTPTEVTTSCAIVATVALVAQVGEFEIRDRIATIGLWIFGLAVMVHLVFVDSSAAVVEGVKYGVFAVMSAVILSPRGGHVLAPARQVMIASGALAMVAHLAAIAVVGRTDFYYGLGEALGFGSDFPHQTALMALILGGALIESDRLLSFRVLGGALGILIALATGVRASLVAVAAMFAASARTRLATRVALALGIVALAGTISGFGGAALTRVSLVSGEPPAVTGPSGQDPIGELASSRTRIWSAALDGWMEEEAGTWVFGAGFQSVAKYTGERLNREFGPHSDVVGTLTQLGVVGLVGWLLIWCGLLRARIRVVILAPIATFAVLNAGLLAVGPTVYGLALAASANGNGRETRE